MTPRNQPGRTVNLEGATWRKSSRSNPNGQCVEVAFVPNHVATRDSKALADGSLVFNEYQWTAFLNQIKTGHS